MQLKFHNVSAQLAQHTFMFAHLTIEAEELEKTKFLPDNNTSLTLFLSENPMVYDAFRNITINHRITFSGQYTEPVLYSRNEALAIINIDFNPWAAYAIFGLDQHLLLNQTFNAVELLPGLQQVLPKLEKNLKNPDQCIQLLEDYLLTQLQIHQGGIDQRIVKACQEILSCKKDSSPKDRRIQIDELLDYQIVEEYQPNANVKQSVGTYPVLQIGYFTKEGNNLYTKNTVMFASNSQVYSTALEYDESTGISKLKAPFGYYEFTRDNNNKIQLIKSVHDANSIYYTSSHFKSSYIQLIKLNTSRSFEINNYYKAANADTYYGFNNSKWFYKASGPVTATNFDYATWNYTKLSAFIWHGFDGGSAKLENKFIIIPKGNGWKGEHVDKDLLLVQVQNPNSLIMYANGPYGTYILQN